MNHRRFADLDRDTFIRKAREAALMVAFDEPAALEALPRLLPEAGDREEAMRIIGEIIELHPKVAPEVRDVQARVERILR